MRTSRVSRLQGFLLASAALISVVVASSGLLVGRFFERHVRAEEEEYTAQVVQIEAHEHLLASDFEGPEPWAEREFFKLFLKRELPGVFRIKVYDRAGQIIWSDEPRLIGMTFPDNPYVTKALKGEVTTVLEIPRRSEHVYERTRGYVTEAYVPISFPEDPAVVGVIEIYKDATEVVQGIRRTQLLIWGFAGGMGLFLYVALAFVAWRASVNELRAIEALREAQAQLVKKERLAAVGQVVVGLHHEILNPLTGILGALQLLKREGMAQTKKSEALAEAEAEIRKIERLIRRLPALRRTTGSPYVGETTMLDLKRSCGEEET